MKRTQEDFKIIFYLFILYALDGEGCICHGVWVETRVVSLSTLWVPGIELR